MSIRIDPTKRTRGGVPKGPQHKEFKTGVSRIPPKTKFHKPLKGPLK